MKDIKDAILDDAIRSAIELDRENRVLRKCVGICGFAAIFLFVILCVLLLGGFYG